MTTLDDFLADAKPIGYAQWDSIEALVRGQTAPIGDVLAAIERVGLKIIDEAEIDLAIGDGDFVDDSVRAYLREICLIPVLSVQREKELVHAMASSEKAKADLVEAHLRISVALAGHFPRPDMHILDLIVEGNNGLLEATNSFDPTRGYSFRSYAYWCVRSRIKA